MSDHFSLMTGARPALTNEDHTAAVTLTSPGLVTTVKLHINYEKGCSVSELAEVLQNQWHSNFTDYSIERIQNGQDSDIFSVSLKVPKTILPEHYFVYKGRKPSDSRFRNLVLLEQESF